MAKKFLGFVEPSVEPQRVEAFKITIKGIDGEYQRMIALLKIEKKQLANEIKHEKRIKRELVKLHKMLLHLGKKVAERSAVLAHVYALQGDDPQRALTLLNDVERLDSEIGPLYNEMSTTLRKHTIPDIAEMYNEMGLNKEQIKNIREIANTITNRLGQIMSSFNIQEPETIRRNIYFTNPRLR